MKDTNFTNGHEFFQIDAKDSWLMAAMERNVPIFVPGWEDSTLGNMFAAHCIAGRIKNVHTVRTGIEYMTKAGAKLTDKGRLIFPRALVEDTLAKCARNFVLHGQDPRHDPLRRGRDPAEGGRAADVELDGSAVVAAVRVQVAALQRRLQEPFGG